MAITLGQKPTTGSLSGPLGAVYDPAKGGTIGTQASTQAAGGAWYRDPNGVWKQSPTVNKGAALLAAHPQAMAGSYKTPSSIAPSIQSQLAGLFGGAGGGGVTANLPLGAVGGGGAGSVGAGSGMGPGANPAAQYTAQTQQNPYITQLMALSQQQFAQPLDRAKERATTREELTRRMRESQQTAAAQGRGGMWGAQQQQLMGESARALTGQEAGFADEEARMRNALLGTMTGIAGAGTADLASQMQNTLAAAKLAQDSSQWQAEYPYRMKALADQSVNSRLGALSSIIGLL